MSRESGAPESEPDLEFSTAADLREEARSTTGGAADAGTDGDGAGDADDPPSFDIPQHPERTFPRVAGVEYEGGTVFELEPDNAGDESTLAALTRAVLDEGPYRYGDWFDLPLPVFLVHDDDTGDTFRVAVRDGAVELHVRPETDPAGLRAFHDRLPDDRAWSVTVRRR